MLSYSKRSREQWHSNKSNTKVGSARLPGHTIPRSLLPKTSATLPHLPLCILDRPVPLFRSEAGARLGGCPTVPNFPKCWGRYCHWALNPHKQLLWTSLQGLHPCHVVTSLCSSSWPLQSWDFYYSGFTFTNSISWIFLVPSLSCSPWPLCAFKTSTTLET